MKTFYTERDIVDLHAAGVTEIKIDSEVVLTDLAREKAEAFGLQLRPVEVTSGLPEAEAATPTLAASDLVAQVKARVIARLGTTAYNEVLDQVIPQVLAQLARLQPSSVSTTPAAPSANDY
ncbi:MAG: hypothetical protein KDF65_13400 [Anaerolineae bacterium]|nr:hypothetical protein [Anaerolineae bacterium]